MAPVWRVSKNKEKYTPLFKNVAIWKKNMKYICLLISYQTSVFFWWENIRYIIRIHIYIYIYIYIKKRSLDCDLFCFKAQRKRLEQEINVECFSPLLDSGTELASCNIKLVVEGPTDRVLNTNPIVRHSKFHRKDTSRPLHFERTFD